MLMEVKNQLKIMVLSVRYNIMREMTNQVTFLTNIIFMMLNNASFIIQWVILFQLKDDFGGYQMDDVLALWALSASTYGLSHILFLRAYHLSDLIMHGKLDAYLVQPKSVILNVITSGTSTPAIGDLLYGYIIIFIFHAKLDRILLFTYFTITGAIILTAFAILFGSLSFWIVKGDIIASNLNNSTISFSTYPEGIFKGVVKMILYTIIPVGFVVYTPLNIMLNFNLSKLLYITVFTIFISLFACFVFNRGLKRYSSSNLMSARI